MNTFLYQIASYYYDLLGDRISEYKFIFPSKRATIYFRHYLSMIAEQPIFAPALQTINDFIRSLKPEIRVIDHTELLFELYNVYREIHPSPESFNDFIYWGNIMLRDFDTIDRHRIDSQEIFSNTTNLKELMDQMEYIDEETQLLLAEFFRGFEPSAGKTEEELSEYKRQFIRFWQELNPIYQELNARLLQRGVSYEGHIYKIISEQVTDIVDDYIQTHQLSEEKKLVFCGLFSIEPAEEKLLSQFEKRKVAEFCWDEHVRLLQDTDQADLPEHPIARRINELKHKLGQIRGDWSNPTGSLLPKTIEVISCNGAVSQVKLLPQIFQELNVEQEDEQELRTAVILPNENLLIPAVNSFPSELQKINITLGYPLERTPISVLVKRWMKLLKSERIISGERCYPIDKLLALTNTALLHEYDPSLSRLSELISEQKFFYISEQKVYELTQQAKEQVAQATPTIAELIFSPINSAIHLIERIEQLLMRLVPALPEDEEIEQDDTSMTSPAESGTDHPLSDFDIEFIYHYLNLSRRIGQLLSQYEVETDVCTTLMLIDNLAQSINIPFEGNPLEGIQVMGMLEARSLQFPNLIILSAQEGSLPANKPMTSLIPHVIRQGFGLPTIAGQEALASYIFFQAIGRTQHLTLLYGEQEALGGQGQESRYIHQLEYLYNCPIHRRTLQVDIEVPEHVTLSVEKTPEVMQELSKFLHGSKDEETRFLSASSINQYIACSLRFYYEQVQNARESDSHSLLMESNEFGTILHNTMQALYQPYENKVLNKAEVRRWLAHGNTHIGKAVANEYRREYLLKSGDLSPLAQLYCQMIEDYIRSIVSHDLKRETITYIASEYKFYEDLPLPSGKAVHIKGAIDRIDKIGDSIRVIDYKTGKAKLTTPDILALFASSGEHKAITQTLLYCEALLLKEERCLEEPQSQIPWSKGSTLSPNIYQLQELQRNSRDKKGYESIIKIGKTPIEDYKSVREEYLQLLHSTLENLFDPNIPFVQTEHTNHCRLCPFKLSCGR